MSLVSFGGVDVDFAGDVVFRNATFGVGRGETWGVVGRNGSGKTTLFRLITGELEPTSGSVSKAPGVRVNLLDQHRAFRPASQPSRPSATSDSPVPSESSSSSAHPVPSESLSSSAPSEPSTSSAARNSFDSSNASNTPSPPPPSEPQTVWDAAAAPFAELLTLERSIGELATALADNSDDAALSRYDRAMERFQREGGYTFRARVDAVLDGLGFDPAAAKSQPLEQLSGGERGRVGLARQLVAPGDILLLDEPTNHLDLETTAWLEEYIDSLDIAVMVISHDRAFLQNVVDHVLHLEANTVTPYAAGYAAFVEQRRERRLTESRAYRKQQQVIESEKDYIRRNIAGQNTRQAKGRRKRLERMPRLAPPPGAEGTMSLTLEVDERGGDQVVMARDATIAVQDRTLVEGFDVVVRRGETVGMIGPNGAGKSTLLRALVGEHPLESGELRTGASIRHAYYRQTLAQVPPEQSLFDTIHDLRPRWNRGQIQSHLGRFGFSGDAVQRTAGTLSGGEQARVALAMIMLSGANLLLFDEPTNHLDVESIEVLEDALTDYPGTVILVSHDRTLLRTLATRVWSLKDGRVEDFPGSFEEWEEVHAARRRKEAAAAEEERRRRRLEEKEKARRAHSKRQSRGASTHQVSRKVEEAEERVTELESRVASLEDMLKDPDRYQTPEGSRRALELGAELETVRSELEQAIRAWERASEALEEAVI